jgi:hypothetical protein
VKGVNSDGIDIDGCKDVMISDCHISTGDDAICLKSTNRDGKYTNCENITVTNCTLTSTSAALKIGTETFGDFRNIVFSNCVISNTNRGIGIFVRDGGTVSDVIFSNITMRTDRKHFNWWGDGDAIHFVLLKRTPQSKLGTIRNILVENVVAHGQGTSLVSGHPEKELENITLSNVQLFMHPESLPDKRATHALAVSRVKSLQLRDVSVRWDTLSPEPAWGSALRITDVAELTIDHFTGRQGLIKSDAPAIFLEAIGKGIIRNSVAPPGTGTFLVTPAGTAKKINLSGNDVSLARQKLKGNGKAHATTQNQRK